MENAGLCPGSVSRSRHKVVPYKRRWRSPGFRYVWLLFFLFRLLYLHVMCEIGSPTPPSFFNYVFHYYVCFIYMLCVTLVPSPLSLSSPYPSTLTLFSNVHGWILLELLLRICSNYVCLAFFRRMQSSAPWQCQQKEDMRGFLRRDDEDEQLLG